MGKDRGHITGYESLKGGKEMVQMINVVREQTQTVHQEKLLVEESQ